MLAKSWFPGACFALALANNAAGQAPPSLQIATDFRFGAVDGPQALTHVGNVLIAKDGSIIIAQPLERLVKILSPAGALHRRFGRHGRGPGEFESISAIGLKGDSIFVSDSELRRVTIFDPAGALAKVLNIASPMLGTPPRIYFATAPEVLFDDGSALVKPELPPAHLVLPDASVPFLRISPEGLILDTLAWAKPAASTYVPVISGASRVFVQPPFPDDDIVVLCPDASGLVLIRRPVPTSTQATTFVVMKKAPDGRVLYETRISYTPIPLTDDIIQGVLGPNAAKWLERGVSTDDVKQALRRASHLPRYLPPVTEALATHDGGLWIRLENVAAEMTRWLGFDAAGHPVGTLTAARALSIRAARGSRLIAVERDTLDVEYIVGLRIGS